MLNRSRRADAADLAHSKHQPEGRLGARCADVVEDDAALRLHVLEAKHRVLHPIHENLDHLNPKLAADRHAQRQSASPVTLRLPSRR
jgi:hypothetical protein